MAKKERNEAVKEVLGQILSKIMGNIPEEIVTGHIRLMRRVGDGISNYEASFRMDLRREGEEASDPAYIEGKIDEFMDAMNAAAQAMNPDRKMETSFNDTRPQDKVFRVAVFSFGPGVISPEELSNLFANDMDEESGG